MLSLKTIWTDDDQLRNAVCKSMPYALCPFGFPREETAAAVEQCLQAFMGGTVKLEYEEIRRMTGKGGKISKTTGKVMSDSIQGSVDRMARQLPDILIPDFVEYMEKLEAHPEAVEKYEPDWQHRGVWYKSQKQHVMNWLREQMTHGGEVLYHRDNLNISSRTSYNHWNNPGMALWLLAALGENDEVLVNAAEEAHDELNVRKRSGIIRKHFSFDRVVELMSRDPDGEKIIIRTADALQKRIG